MAALPKSADQQANATPGLTQKKTMNIGAVVDLLVKDFPDLTLSRIRYYESEGLVNPRRTASGYRRFTESDVERIRYVLTAQRDNYLPLKVIKDHLDAMDDGTVVALMAGKSTPQAPQVDNRATTQRRFTRADLATTAGVPNSFIDKLVDAKLIQPCDQGLFEPDDAAIVSAVQGLVGMGLSLRHLEHFKKQADRSAALISQFAAMRSAQYKNDQGLHAEEISLQMSSVVSNLYSVFMRQSLRASDDKRYNS